MCILAVFLKGGENASADSGFRCTSSVIHLSKAALSNEADGKALQRGRPRKNPADDKPKWSKGWSRKKHMFGQAFIIQQIGKVIEEISL